MKLREAAGQPCRPVTRSGIDWLDSVLGGGASAGSVVLLHGEPGAGKSTLALQWAAGVRGSWYFSAEEDLGRVGDRARRLGLLRSDMELEAARPGSIVGALTAGGGAPLIVIDSLQAIAGHSYAAQSAATSRAVDHARATGACVVLVCHVNKRGQLAGPRRIEHLVDVGLALERGPPRSIVAQKNRFGPAGEPVELAMHPRHGLVA